VGVEAPGEYKVVLSSDEKRFGGHDRIDIAGRYFTTPMEWNGRMNWLQVSCPVHTIREIAKHQVYTPARTALILGL
jgi:1,4-alpha-glucan branching enzyme